MSNMKVAYFQVPNEVFDGNWGLTIYEIAVYSYLCRCSNQGSEAYPSLITIAKKTGMGRSKAAETIKALERNKLIKKENRRGRSNRYLVLHRLEPVHDMDGCSPRDGQVPVHDTNLKKNVTIKNKLKESSNSHTVISDKQEKIIDELLELYYDLYRRYTSNEPTTDISYHKGKLESLVNQHSTEKITARLNAWFENADTYTIGSNYPLPLFVAQFDSAGSIVGSKWYVSNYYERLG